MQQSQTQLKLYLHRYHRECWPAWVIERERTNVAEQRLSADDIAARRQEFPQVFAFGITYIREGEL